jgi:hypothetical protein
MYELVKSLRIKSKGNWRMWSHCAEASADYQCSEERPPEGRWLSHFFAVEYFADKLLKCKHEMEVVMAACCCSCRWGETMSLNCSLQQAYFSFPRWYIWVWMPCWNNNREKLKNSERNLSQCHLSVTNPTQTDQGANLGLHGERPATNRLIHSMSMLWHHTRKGIRTCRRQSNRRSPHLLSPPLPKAFYVIQ